MNATERIEAIEKKLNALSFPTWEMAMAVDDVQWLVTQARAAVLLREAAGDAKGGA